MKNFRSKSQKIGEIGEGVACIYLDKHGYSILERNYTRKWGEIDIIAKKNDMLYFVEVKSMSVSSMTDDLSKIGRPEDNMHIWKVKRLRRVVETYMISQRIGSTSWQFDLLVVYLDIENKLARVKVVDNIIL